MFPACAAHEFRVKVVDQHEVKTEQTKRRELRAIVVNNGKIKITKTNVDRTPVQFHDRSRRGFPAASRDRDCESLGAVFVSE